MSGRATIQRINQVQPIWSTSRAEARARVIKLYKTWYRQIPHIGELIALYHLRICSFDTNHSSADFCHFCSVEDYNLPQSTSQCRAKLHEEFMKQQYLTDIRQIDTLLMEKQLELKEICFMQKDRSHLLNYWPNKSGNSSQPTPFLSKFLIGQSWRQWPFVSDYSKIDDFFFVNKTWYFLKRTFCIWKHYWWHNCMNQIENKHVIFRSLMFARLLLTINRKQIAFMNESRSIIEWN